METEILSSLGTGRQAHILLRGGGGGGVGRERERDRERERIRHTIKRIRSYGVRYCGEDKKIGNVRNT